VKKKGQAEIIGAVFFIILMMMAFVTYYYIYNDFSNYVYLENQKLQQQQIASAQELTQILSNANSYFQSNVSSISSAPSAPSSPPFIYLLDNQGLTPSKVYSLYMNVSVPFEFSQNNLELNGYNANANSLYLYVYAKSSGNYVIIGEYLLPPASRFDLTIPVSSQYILNHEIELLLKSYVITITPSGPGPGRGPGPTYKVQLTPIELSNYTFYKIANLGLMNLFNSNITTYYPNGTSFYLISNNNKNAYTLDYNNIIPESSNATLFIDLYNNNNKVDSVTISWENTHFIALIKPKNDTRYAIPLGSISGPLKITVSGNEITGLKEAIIQAIVPHVIIKNVGSYPIQIIRIWSQSNPPKYVNVSITLMPGQQVDLSGYFVNGANTIKVVTSDGNYYSFYY